MHQRKASNYLLNVLVAVTACLMAEGAHATGPKRPVRLAMNPEAVAASGSETPIQGPMFIGQFRTQAACERVRTMPTRPEESFSWCSCNGAPGGTIQLFCGFGPG